MKTERTKGIFFADKGDLPTETYLRIDIGEGELCDVASFACDETDNIEANAEFIVKACNSYSDLLKVVEALKNIVEYASFDCGGYYSINEKWIKAAQKELNVSLIELKKSCAK